MKLLEWIEATMASAGVPPEFGRFVINGLMATTVHFTILSLCIEVLELQSAAISNFLAAVVASMCSFFGNRHYVFKKSTQRLFAQAWRFAVLYLATAVFHGSFLLVWTDWLDHDYRIGFVIATAIQVVASFLGARILVFSK
jgi:putative flippase GtrA